MYPLDHFRLFPAYPVTRRVFVAMDFSPKYDARWFSVIRPAIQAVSLKGELLEALRVDTSRVSASLLSVILEGIGRELLVFADITTVHKLDDGRPLRNANVMYELGIAHATRLPEENLVFRSDNDPLPFDVANIRVNSYQPEGDVPAARKQVAEAIVNALESLDDRRRLSVQKAAEALDARTALRLMNTMATKQPIRPRRINTLGGILATRSIERLLEIGALTANWPQLDEDGVRAALSDGNALGELLSYEITPFGAAVAAHIAATVFGSVSRERREAIRREVEVSRTSPKSDEQSSA